MRIATFNINNIRRRLPNLIDWLRIREPDVVCLQELKCSDGEFPAGEIAMQGYGAVWQGERTWNGVAILARGSQPVVTRRSLPGDASDRQSRYIEAAVNGVLIGCIYLPNGNPQPGPKFDYKLGWFDRLIRHAATLLEERIPAVLAGDFNVAPTEIDIYPTKSWKDDALVHPGSRAAFQRLVAQGWTDALRELRPDERIYTFWHYLRRRWERDAGLRLDHLLLSPALSAGLRDVGVDRNVRAKPGASDHAPVWIELALRSRAGRDRRHALHQAYPDGAPHAPIRKRRKPSRAAPRAPR